jgi:hypothetical protein
VKAAVVDPAVVVVVSAVKAVVVAEAPDSVANHAGKKV